MNPKKIYYIIFLLALSLDFCSKVFTQPDFKKFKQITIENGLSQNSVKVIFQDRTGFIWFGTRFGLNCYDGYSFKIFRNIPGKNSISDNVIYSIFEDKVGNLWIGTGAGLNRYDKAKGAFEVFKKDSVSVNSIAGNRINDIVEDKYGYFWIATEAGLSRFDYRNRAFINYFHNDKDPNSISNNSVNSLCIDNNDNLWIGMSDMKLDKIILSSIHGSKNPNIIEFKHYKVSLEKNIKPIVYSITKLYIDRSNYLWIGTDGTGLYKFNLSLKQIRLQNNYIFFDIHGSERYIFNKLDPSSISSNNITSITEDRKNNIWIGTWDNGLNRTNNKEKGFIRYIHNNADPASISNNCILSLLEDRSENLWVGTYNSGISKSDGGRKDIKLYRSNPSEKTGLSNDMVSAIYEDEEDILWVGTREGLNELDRKNNKCTYHLYDAAQKNRIGNNFIRCIAGDGLGKIWIGTNSGLYSFAQKTRTFEKFIPPDLDNISRNNIRALYIDKAKNLWIGTRWGLDKYNLITKKITYYENLTNDSNSISSNYIWSIFEDRNSNIWVGTVDGLNRLEKNNSRFKRYIIRDSDNPQANNLIASIGQDLDGNIWAGTFGSGILKVNNTNPHRESNNNNNKDIFSDKIETQRITGLNNIINGIICDDHNNLWISTDNGINKYNPDSRALVSFDIKDGLQGNEFNTGAAFKSKKGEIFFGGINGLNSFFPEKIIRNKHIPNIVLTSFKEFGRPVEFKSDLSDLKEIDISYSNNFITFEFAALDFTEPSKNQYTYKLEGFDENWIECGTSTQANYTNLDGGEYIFRVKGSNNDKVWNNEGISIKLIVRPPFWRTTWFRILIVLAIVGLLFLFYKIRTKALENQKRKLEGLVHDRTEDLRKSIIDLKESEKKLSIANADKDKIFSIIAHDLRGSIGNLMAALGFLVDRLDSLDENETRKFIHELSKTASDTYNLLENLLNWARNQRGTIIFEPKYEAINYIVNEVIEYSSPYAKEKNISLSTNLNELVYASYDINMLMIILRNLVNNALKFTPKGGNVQILANELDSFVEVSVIDSGIGMNNDFINKLFKTDNIFSMSGTEGETGTGLGLILCKEFIERSGGAVRVESEINHGSKFIFTIPKN